MFERGDRIIWNGEKGTVRSVLFLDDGSTAVDIMLDDGTERTVFSKELTALLRE